MEIIGDRAHVNSAVQLKYQEHGPVPSGLSPHLKVMSLCAHWCCRAVGLYEKRGGNIPQAALNETGAEIGW